MRHFICMLGANLYSASQLCIFRKGFAQASINFAIHPTTIYLQV